MYLNLYNTIKHTEFEIAVEGKGLDREKWEGHSPKAKIVKKISKLYIHKIAIIICVPES